MGTGQAGHSPLTELLAPGEDVTTILDDQYDIQEDPEIAEVVSNIPSHTGSADVEMEEENAALGFKPKVSHSGYNVNLVRHSDDTAPGLISPVMAQESQMLDEDAVQTKAPGTGRLGTKENPGCPITNKKK